MGWTNRKNFVRLLARHVVGEGGAILLTGSGQLDAGHDGRRESRVSAGGLSIEKCVYQSTRISRGGRSQVGGCGTQRPRRKGVVGTNGGKGTRVGASKKGETTKIWPWRRRRGAQDTSEGDGNRVGRGRGGRRVGGTRVERKLEGGWGEDGMERMDVQPRAGLSVCCCWLLLWCGGGGKRKMQRRGWAW